MKNTVVMLFVGIMLIFLFIGCRNNGDSEYFNGEIQTIKDVSTEIKEIPLKRVTLNGANYGYISVYDSLMFFMNPKLNSCFFNLFNVNTGEEMGTFCNKGAGPEEAIAFGPISQFFKVGEELKTLLFAPNEEKLFVWNLTRSVRENATVIDSIISFSWRKENRGACYNEIYFFDDTTLLARVSSVPLNDKEATVPYYQKRMLYTNELVKNYPIYKKQVVESNGAVIIPECFLGSWDAIKPDGTKVAIAMSHLPQLNILDLETGKVIGYRMSGGEDFSIFNGRKNMKNYFIRLQADDNYIYAVYWGKDMWGEREIPYVDTIYVFDWHGRLVKKIKVDGDINDIFLDTVNNRLYVTSPTTNDVSYLDLNFLM